MKKKTDFYIGSVCLERNRWGSRKPSFEVSRWLSRFGADGFDGVELWENHYAAADEAEKTRLVDHSSMISIFNSYAGFGDDAAAAREIAARAAAELGVEGIKFNLGSDRSKMDTYRRNLMCWEGQLPASCRLLCECHQGSVLEKVQDSFDFFADLDPDRFGVIVHVSAGDQDGVSGWMEKFGPRVRHLHVQMRAAECDPGIPEARESLNAGFDVVKANGFDGSLSIEFTRGIGREEDIEVIYKNALRDLAYCREVLA